MANNQFANECKEEIASIRQAAFEEGGEAYVPELLYLVVQQRTRMRFAAVDQRTGEVPRGQQGNVPCCTVVDQDVVSRTPDGLAPNNFYFVGQYGLKGTCRPTHYHVLANDIANASLQDVERLTADLCFLYARATKVVSRPAPVYYAHRAAFLAQYYVRTAHMHTARMHTRCMHPCPHPRPHSCPHSCPHPRGAHRTHHDLAPRPAPHLRSARFAASSAARPLLLLSPRFVFASFRTSRLAAAQEPNYKEIGDAWETGSTTSTGSGGSGSQQAIPEIRLNETASNTVFWA